MTTLKIAVSGTRKFFRTIYVFFDWNVLLLQSYLPDWLTAGLIPLPFQPDGVRVEYRIILQQDICGELTSSTTVNSSFSSISSSKFVET
jgi:hypothetical protein